MPPKTRPPSRAAGIVCADEVCVALLVCPNCGREEMGDALRCRSCGAALPHKTILEMPRFDPQQMRSCAQCQSALPALATRCPVCGSKVPDDAQRPPLQVKIAQSAKQSAVQIAKPIDDNSRPGMQRSQTRSDRPLVAQAQPPSGPSQPDSIQTAPPQTNKSLQQQLQAAQRKLERSAMQNRPSAQVVKVPGAPKKPANQADASTQGSMSAQVEVHAKLSAPRPRRSFSQNSVHEPGSALPSAPARPAQNPAPAAQADPQSSDSLAATLPAIPRPDLSNLAPGTEDALARAATAAATITATQRAKEDRAQQPTLEALPQIHPCPNCTSPQSADRKFCAVCGAPLGDAAADPKTVATLPSIAAVQSNLQSTQEPQLTLLDPTTRTPLKTFAIAGQGRVGRAPDAELRIDQDPFLGLVHAWIFRRGNAVVLRPSDHHNGVFVRLTRPQKVLDGTRIRMGQQLLLLQLDGSQAPQLMPQIDAEGTHLLGSPMGSTGLRLVQLFADGSHSISVHQARTLTIGHSGCDINFAQDPGIAQRHTRLLRAGDVTVVEDLGSPNGTFISVREELTLQPGTELLMGQQLLRLELFQQKQF